MTCASAGCKMKPGAHDFCVHHRPDDEFPECSICLKAIRRTKDTLDCNHSFHRRCIDYWAERSNTCPMCREPFGPEINGPEPWLNVLSDTIHEQLSQAVRDLNIGARTVDIHIQFNVEGVRQGS